MAVTSLRGEPTARLSFGRLAAINAFWFGGGAHWQPIYISLIPVGATLIAGSNADLLIGRVTAAGGVFALLTPILVGWLSDRTVTRWGRRRPWMVAGTILNIIPERCEFLMEWRTIPGDDAARHVERMWEFVATTIEPAIPMDTEPMAR